MQVYARNNGNFSLSEGNEGEPDSNEGEVFAENSQSAYQNNVPRQAENANFANSVNLNLHTSVIDADMVHQASKEVNQSTSPQRCQDTTQRPQSSIQPNLPDYEVLPTEIKNKIWGNISHESFLILSMVFTMKLSISGEIFSMYHREERKSLYRRTSILDKAV